MVADGGKGGMRRHGGQQGHNIVVFIVRKKRGQVQFRHILQGSCRTAVVVIFRMGKDKQGMRGYC